MHSHMFVGNIVHAFVPGDEKPHAALVINADPNDDGQVFLQVFSRNGGRYSQYFPKDPGKTNGAGYRWEIRH